MPPINDQFLSPDDVALNPGCALLEFLISIGADEFTLRIMYSGGSRAESDRLAATLAFASLGEHTRECTVTYRGEANPRSIELFRLDEQALKVLREIMPRGIFAPVEYPASWAEDLCVYRRGELLLGIITHEREAFLRLPDDERQQWESRMASIRRTTQSGERSPPG